MESVFGEEKKGDMSVITLEQFMAMSMEERSVLPKARVKKLTRLEAEVKRKEEKAAEVAEELERQKQKRLDAAAEVKIEIDSSLPEALKCKVRDIGDKIGKRIVICGWVHHIRWDGKKLMFIELRDGTGFLQCVLTGDLCMTVEAVTLHREASVTLYGTLHEDERAKGTFNGYELQVDYWQLVGSSPSEIESLFTTETNPDVLLNNRHLVIRGTQVSLHALLNG